MFREKVADSTQGTEGTVSPLVKQAEVFSLRLNPPKTAEKPLDPTKIMSSLPPVRPSAPSPRFKLRATSYYPNQPRKSMALIAELGASEGSERWAKEGAQLGHFVIQEIRRGAIVYRDGNNLREMVVERGASLPGIVRDIRPGIRRVSAAVGDTEAGTAILIGPNSIEIAGGN